MKSASANGNVPLLRKGGYLVKLFGMRLSGAFRSDGELGPWKDFDEYAEFFQRFSGRKETLRSLRVLEIGYGQRPWRMICLLAMGADAWGIDLEYPMFGFHPSRLMQTYRKNGLERALKSAFRSLFFDERDLRKLKQEVEARGFRSDFDKSRFLVGDASEKLDDLLPKRFDLVISEDVFEHIPPEHIEKALAKLSGLIAEEGLLLIRPHVFTGLAGGHDPEFYPHLVRAGRVDPERAWSHLWDAGFVVNTFLNRLRVNQYRELFGRYFQVVAEIPQGEGLGRNYLTPEIRQKVPSDISDDELMLNQVMFVLKPFRSGAAA